MRDTLADTTPDIDRPLIYESLRRAFTTVDKSKDGELSVDNVIPVLSTFGVNVTSNESLLDLIRDAYVDQCGQIVYTDLDRVLVEGTECIRTSLRDAFNFLDTDSNGYINGSDIHKLLVNIGEVWTDSDLLDVMKGVDASGDGKISFSEFCTFMGYDGDDIEDITEPNDDPVALQRHYSISECREKLENDCAMGRSMSACSVGKPEWNQRRNAIWETGSVSESVSGSVSSKSEGSSGLSTDKVVTFESANKTGEVLKRESVNMEIESNFDKNHDMLVDEVFDAGNEDNFTQGSTKNTNFLNTNKSDTQLEDMETTESEEFSRRLSTEFPDDNVDCIDGSVSGCDFVRGFGPLRTMSGPGWFVDPRLVALDEEMEDVESGHVTRTEDGTDGMNIAKNGECMDGIVNSDKQSHTNKAVVINGHHDIIPTNNNHKITKEKRHKNEIIPTQNSNIEFETHMNHDNYQDKANCNNLFSANKTQSKTTLTNKNCKSTTNKLKNNTTNTNSRDIHKGTDCTDGGNINKPIAIFSKVVKTSNETITDITIVDKSELSCNSSVISSTDSDDDISSVSDTDDTCSTISDTTSSSDQTSVSRSTTSSSSSFSPDTLTFSSNKSKDSLQNSSTSNKNQNNRQNTSSTSSSSKICSSKSNSSKGRVNNCNKSASLSDLGSSLTIKNVNKMSNQDRLNCDKDVGKSEIDVRKNRTNKRVVKHMSNIGKYPVTVKTTEERPPMQRRNSVTTISRVDLHQLVRKNTIVSEENSPIIGSLTERRNSRRNSQLSDDIEKFINGRGNQATLTERRNSKDLTPRRSSIDKILVRQDSSTKIILKRNSNDRLSQEKNSNSLVDITLAKKASKGLLLKRGTTRNLLFLRRGSKDNLLQNEKEENIPLSPDEVSRKNSKENLPGKDNLMRRRNSKDLLRRMNSKDSLLSRQNSRDKLFTKVNNGADLVVSHNPSRRGSVIRINDNGSMIRETGGKQMLQRRDSSVSLNLHGNRNGDASNVGAGTKNIMKRRNSGLSLSRRSSVISIESVDSIDEQSVGLNSHRSENLDKQKISTNINEITNVTNGSPRIFKRKNSIDKLNNIDAILRKRTSNDHLVGQRLDKVDQNLSENNSGFPRLMRKTFAEIDDKNGVNLNADLYESVDINELANKNKIKEQNIGINTKMPADNLNIETDEDNIEIDHVKLSLKRRSSLKSTAKVIMKMQSLHANVLIKNTEQEKRSISRMLERNVYTPNDTPRSVLAPDSTKRCSSAPIRPKSGSNGYFKRMSSTHSLSTGNISQARGSVINLEMGSLKTSEVKHKSRLSPLCKS